MYIVAILLIALATYGVQSVTSLKSEVQARNVRIQKTQTELKQLNTELDKVKQDKNASQQQIQQLEKDKQDLQQQLQAKADEKSKLAQIADTAINTVTATSVAHADPLPSNPTGGCGDNYYASYIYANESGGHVIGNCNPTILNAEGCIGIGQACPASKLIAACPNLDYACENAYFIDYANTKYGGWEGAYDFWTANHWW